MVTTIFDFGSQRNLILEIVVKQFGLATTEHPSPYTLGLLNEDTKHTINK